MSGAYAKKDWSELKVGNNGDVTQVPFHLHELAKADCPRWQHTLKLKMLYDDGKIYSAAAKAIPEVVELLRIDATPNKDTLLNLIAATVCGKTQTRMVWGLDMNHPEIKNFYARGVAKDVWRSTWIGRDIYLSLLEHSDEKVRSAAAFLLAFDFEGANQVQIKLEPLILKESDTKTKASMLLCLGLARQYAPTQGRQLEFTTFIKDTTNELLVRNAATLGFLYESRELVTLCDSHKSILIDACSLIKISHNGYPWNGGIIDMHVCRVVEGRCVEGALVAAEILAECIRRSGPISRSHEWAGGILTLAFPKGENVQTAGPFFISADYADFSSISDRQRALLEILSSYSFTAPFQSYGIPSQVCDRRRWLGLEKPGPMERVVDVEVLGKLRRWPVWKCIRAQYASRPYKSVDVEALLGKVLTPTQLLEVRLEYSVMAYGLTWGGGELADEVFKMVMEHSKEMLPYAREHLRYMSRMFNEFGSVHVNCGAKAAITAMHVLIKEGFVNEILPEDDILLEPGTSVIYKHFDLARREKFILDCLESCFVEDDTQFWYAKNNIHSVLKNLTHFATENVANRLFDLRDHILQTFKGFFEEINAIETECPKYIDKNPGFSKVVKKRLTVD